MQPLTLYLTQIIKTYKIQIIKNWKNPPKSLENISMFFCLQALSELGFYHIQKIRNCKYIIFKKIVEDRVWS
jgi:hypothetical protein